MKLASKLALYFSQTDFKNFGLWILKFWPRHHNTSLSLCMETFFQYLSSKCLFTLSIFVHTCTHVHILCMHFSMIFQSQIREKYNSKCELAAVLLPSLLPSLLAQFISAYAEINSATGNWQLIGNYAILTKNNQRVFWYENGELNGVQFVFFNIWPGLKPEYHFKWHRKKRLFS